MLQIALERSWLPGWTAAARFSRRWGIPKFAPCIGGRWFGTSPLKLGSHHFEFILQAQALHLTHQRRAERFAELLHLFS